jgi:hypothetical protein
LGGVDRKPDGAFALRPLLAAALAAMAAAAAIGVAVSQTAERPVRVDLELVLAVDISRSMSQDEHYLQREGYVEAFRHKDVINAITSGPQGRIAVMYMEWAGDFEPIPLIQWTILDSEKAAKAFADKLANEPVWGEQRTSISRALYTAADYIESNNIISSRQVIDVSGDGPNNAGPGVEEIRNEVLAKGIVINGLPIMLNKPREFYDIDHLDRYYKDCVIGGPAAFIVPVYDLRHFASTVRKKLVLEIAGLEVAPDMAPVQYADNRHLAPDPAPGPQAPGTPALQRVQLKLPKEKTDCMIGEKVWMGGYGRYGGFGDR